MKSILVIAPAFSFPPKNGGDIRLFEILRRISDHYNLHLLSYGKEPGNDFFLLSGVKSSFFVEGAQSPAKHGIWHKMDLWRHSPHGLRLDCDPVFARALKKMIARISPDAVLIEHVYMSQYHHYIKKTVPIFVNCYDVETVKMKRWFADNRKQILSSMRSRLQILSMKKYESSLTRFATAIFTTSELDAKILHAMNRGGCFVSVPNGADLDYFRKRPKESFRGTPAAFFVGSLFYRPNYDAALLLKHSIWPLVRKECPSAECHIAGKLPHSNLKSLNDSSNNIFFHGQVADIRPYLLKSQMLIVPLRIGSGTRIKIIESMATGTPVISTHIGAEGLLCTHNHDIVLEDSITGIADAAISFFSDRRRAFEIGTSGRRLVEEHYTWDASANTMLQTMKLHFNN